MVKDKILVAEDEKNISNFISAVLSANNYDVITAKTGAEACAMITSHCPDLIILDLGLPDMDGNTVIQKVREWSQLPIIVVSARTHESDKVSALDLGADDYITKPFVPVEVLARVRSQLRRYATLGSKPAPDRNLITIGGICLDDRTKNVTVDGESVSLTPTEYAILRLLMTNPGKVYSTQNLYESVWKEAALGSEGAVAVHIRHLREKIEINPSQPRYLKVVWGQGYKMEGDGK